VDTASSCSLYWQRAATSRKAEHMANMLAMGNEDTWQPPTGPTRRSVSFFCKQYEIDYVDRLRRLTT
jgi:hypothetical protein